MQEGHRLFACVVRSKRLIRNVLPRSVVKCSSFHLKGQKNTPQIIGINPLAGWPYCAEGRLTLDKRYAQRHSLLCRGDASQPIGLNLYSTVSLATYVRG